MQVGTENCYAAGYDLFPNPADTKTLRPHLENMKERLGTQFETVIADADYGSEGNYDYCDEKGISIAIKHGRYHKEKIYEVENWY